MSRIGRRIDEPASVDIRLRLLAGAPLSQVSAGVQEIVQNGLSRLPALSSRIATGSVTLF